MRRWVGQEEARGGARLLLHFVEDVGDLLLGEQPGPCAGLDGLDDGHGVELLAEGCDGVDVLRLVRGRQRLNVLHCLSVGVCGILRGRRGLDGRVLRGLKGCR